MKKFAYKIIKSPEEYQSAMELLYKFMESDLSPGTDEYDDFELLALLIEKYEEHNFSLKKPSPIEAIKFRMEQEQLTQKDMTKYFGSPSKTSEVLSGKRNLSLQMIRKLNSGLGIPSDILIQDINKVEEWTLQNEFKCVLDKASEQINILNSIFTTSEFVETFSSSSFVRVNRALTSIDPKFIF